MVLTFVCACRCVRGPPWFLGCFDKLLSYFLFFRLFFVLGLIVVLLFYFLRERQTIKLGDKEWGRSGKVLREEKC